MTDGPVTITPEQQVEMKKQVEAAEDTARANACMLEVNEVFKKHNCEPVIEVTLGSHMAATFNLRANTLPIKEEVKEGENGTK